MKLDKKTEEWFLEELAEGIAYGDSKTANYMNKIRKAYLKSINKPVETTNEKPKKITYSDNDMFIK